MEEILKGEVENLVEVFERWLEYGMDLPVVHEHAINLAPICVKALEEVNAYRMKTLIELPVGVSITWSSGETTNMCPAYVIVYRFQLTDWLKKDWNNKDREKAEKENYKIPNSE